MEWDNDYEVDDEDWIDGPDDPTRTAACGNCGHDIYEDAVSCPVCGHDAVRKRTGLTGKPMWYLALGAAGILAMILVLSGVLAWL